MAKKKVLVILGQTATGKSSLAVDAAIKFYGEIISADSRQVYKGLDIGTGKITKKEMRGVPHYLIDVVSPKKVFTVTQFKELAEEKIKDIIRRGKLPIICGGTGFYIDAIIKNIILPEVPPNKKLRQKLEKLSTENLLSTLRKLDRKRASSIVKKNEQNNRVRIIRAIEIAEALGHVPMVKKNKSEYEFIQIGLLVPKNIHDAKIEKRVEAMFKNGLLKEIFNLKKNGINSKRLQEFGFEYNEPTIDKVISETIKYAKRQMTWFKRYPEITWLEPSQVISFLEKNLK